MNILDKIILHKRKEVKERQSVVSEKTLERGSYFMRPVLSLKEHVQRQDKSGIIAEFKRQSPSKGVINGNASVERITRGYVKAGASGLSVLTDETFFGGSDDDLLRAREHNECPILRKDFTVDKYQILEARSLGADAILLIAAVLTPAESKAFVAFAHGLGLEVLLEVHNEQELMENLDAGADLIGVNNRDLKTFAVSTDVSKKLAPLIPPGVVKVSESGISTPEAILDLRSYGFEGFLIGENFMKHDHPDVAAMEFVQKLKSLSLKL